MKFLVFDKGDLERLGFEQLMNHTTYIIEALNAETAALIFVEEWGDQHSYDTQESDYYVYVILYSVAHTWFLTLPNETTVASILAIATGYRGYKSWRVEEAIDEMDPDLMEDEE